MLIVCDSACACAACPGQRQSDSAKAADLRFSVDISIRASTLQRLLCLPCSKWMGRIRFLRPSHLGALQTNCAARRVCCARLLEKAAVDRAGRSPQRQKIGDYYASCMDEGPSRRPVAKPLEHDLESIAAIKAKEGLAREIVRLHREGADVLFSFDSDSDYRNASQMIAEVDQGAWACPIATTIFKDDAKSVDLRE